MIIATDLHLDEDSEKIVMGEVVPGIERASFERGDNTIALLGDLLNTRYRTHSRLIMALYDAVKTWTTAGKEVHILPGNHDMYSLEGRTVLELFERICKVYREPVVNNLGAWIPFQATTAAFRQAFSFCESISVANGTPLFMHNTVMGAWLNDHTQATEGVPLELFENARVRWRPISGHLHKPHAVGPVTYVGSPWQTSAAEAGQPKGYAVIGYGQNGALIGYEHVPMGWGPRHIQLEAVATGRLDLSTIRPHDIVSVKVAEGVNIGILSAQFAAAGIKNHTLTPEQVQREARLNVAATSSMNDYAKAYVENFTPAGMDKARLLALFGELTA